MVVSDSFNHKENRLALEWEWNHNPEEGCWSFTERPGYLRLRTQSLARDIMTARNTLTQRTIGPKCTFTVELETQGMKVGDYAGLAAFQSNYGTVGVKVESDNSRKLVVCKKGSDGQQSEEESVLLESDKVFLKVAFDFEDGRDIAEFFYSADGRDWRRIGRELHMLYTLDLFTGYRIGIYCFARKETGGYADFRRFSFEMC